MVRQTVSLFQVIDRWLERMQVEAAAVGVGRAALRVCMIAGVNIYN